MIILSHYIAAEKAFISNYLTILDHWEEVHKGDSAQTQTVTALSNRVTRLKYKDLSEQCLAAKQHSIQSCNYTRQSIGWKIMFSKLLEKAAYSSSKALCMAMP